MLHLSNNIKIIRKLAGKTQPEFAKLFTGISLGMQKSYEDDTQPGPVYMQELAELAGVSEKDLRARPLSKKEIKIADLVNKDDLVTTTNRLAEEMLTQKALTRTLLEHVTKLTAKISGRPLEEVAEELLQNTRIKEIDLKNSK